MKSNILIRTSGGVAPKKEIGFGHLYRCINLANALKSHNIFFLVEDFGKSKKIFCKKQIKNVKFFKNEIDIHKDIEITKKTIKEKEIDLVIVDKYKINKAFLQEIKKESKLLYISDLDKTDFPSDVVINGFVGFENMEIKNKFHSKCFLGPKYQIINKNFAKKSIKKKVKFKLLITVGGYDEGGIIDIFLKRWMRLESKFKTKIILGPGTEKSNVVKKALKLFPKDLKIKNKTASMLNEMNSAQFGLCAGGITTYEFAAQKIPFAIIAQNNHQIKTAKQWKKKSMALNLGTVDKITNEKMDKFLDKISKDEITFYQKTILVDGLGAKRAAKIIEKLIKT